jgi:hypothetical protein
VPRGIPPVAQCYPDEIPRRTLQLALAGTGACSGGASCSWPTQRTSHALFRPRRRRRNNCADCGYGRFCGSQHAAGIRGARLIIVPDAGHMLNWEAPEPEVLVDAIGSFQRRPPCSAMMKVAVSLGNPLFAANPPCLIPPHPCVSQRNSQYWHRCVLERCELAASGLALGSPLKPRRGWCRRRSRRIAVLGQQPIQAALYQVIAHQQQHVIESALPILTPRHTPISVHLTNPVQARRKRATKSAVSWVVDRARRRAASRLPDGCSRC